MNIYILLAHPDKTSFNGQLADAYEQKLLLAGHQVRRQNISEMQFDPVLWKGYSVIEQFEPDMQQTQENILWCQKWVIIYPVWWGSVPAILKGLLDRALLPGFGFKYHEKDPFWDQYLAKRSAHVITTSDAPAIWLWWQYGNSDIKAIRKATLEFCGIKPVKVTRIGRVKYLDDDKRSNIIRDIAADYFPFQSVCQKPFKKSGCSNWPKPFKQTLKTAFLIPKPNPGTSAWGLMSSAGIT